MKFDSAAWRLSNALSRFGVKLSQGEVKSFIDEAVYDLNRAQAQSAPVAAPQSSGT